MAANPHSTMTVDEYLEAERHNPIKHEYVDGHVYAMSGGTRAHGLIAANILFALMGRLRGGPCRVYNSDVKVQVTATRYFYPDVSVGCDERDRVNDAEAEAVFYPSVVVEVLSPTTEAYDRGDKFALYRGNKTLQQYVLVNGRRAEVEVYTRGDNGFWLFRSFGPDAEVLLESIDVHVPVAAFYEDVDLSAADETMLEPEA